MIDGPIAPGANVSVDITFTIDPYFQGFAIQNWAEISDDDSDDTYGAYDIDSDPDGDQGNDNQPSGA